MNAATSKIAVVPCSGIGKSLGTVSREAAYELCEVLRPDETQLVALSKLVLGDDNSQAVVEIVLGDDEARERVRAHGAITIDGCKQMCAAKLVRHSGGGVIREVAVFEVFRNHKNLKPEGIAELNAEGLQLARVLAEELAGKLDTIRPQTEGGDNA
jgi:uncharacterized metal-binding protein